jgi:hypothetical protein
MMVAGLALVLVLAMGREADPAALVQQLGSERGAEREAAAAALGRMGREALPVLRVATDSRNPLVRERAAALIRAIEGGSLDRPTRIALDFEDRPLVDVLEAIGARGHLRLALEPEDEGPWRRRPITLKASEPVSFWEAVDRLCVAGRLRFELAAPGDLSEPGDDRPAVRLRLDTGQGRTGPTSYHGPFRVTLTGLHFSQSVGFVRDRGVSTDATVRSRGASPVGQRFWFGLRVMAEPRTILIAAGPPRVDEAADDLGQSLLPAGPRETSPPRNVIGLSAFEYQIDLGRPREPGETIRRLRGSVPVLLAVRRPDPVTIPLADAEGKTYTVDGATLSIQRVDIAARRPIELTARFAAADEADPPNRARASVGDGRLDALAHQIELVDAAGKAIRSLHGGGPSGDGVRMSIRPASDEEEGVGPPDRLRVYTLSRTAAVVPFEFTDLPMP